MSLQAGQKWIERQRAAAQERSQQLAQHQNRLTALAAENQVPLHRPCVGSHTGRLLVKTHIVSRPWLQATDEFIQHDHKWSALTDR